MSRSEFNHLAAQRKAAFKRLRDADCLLGQSADPNWLRQKGRHARGAMYLAGYAVECKLKALAMEANQCRNLQELSEKWETADQDIYNHGLEGLAKRLPLYNRFQQSDVWRDFTGQVNRWRPSWRYDPEDHLNSAALAFLGAVRSVYTWLSNNQ